MSEWQEYQLIDLTSKIGSGATPRGGQESYKDEGISLIRSQNVLDFQFSQNGLAFIDEEQAQKLQNVEVMKDDILLNITGDSVTRVCMVPYEILPARVNQHVSIIRVIDNVADRRFILYYLLNPVFKKYMLKIASDGGTRNALTKRDIESFSIYLPSLDEQRRIAAILSTLDSKIDLLQRQNHTLEQIAQTLFKRWFVEFEFPDEQGQPYKSSGGPMVASELGEIPEGWRVGTLEDVTNISIGRTPPRKEEEWFSVDPKDVKWISIKDLGNCGVFIDKTSEFLTQEAVEKFNISVIPAGTVVLSFKLTVGRVAITTEDMLSNEAIAHLKIENNVLIPEYLYLLFLDFNFAGLGSTSSIATAINSKTIRAIDLIIPTPEILNSFSDHVSPIFSKIKINTHQIQTLTRLRDTLLPKLMSGQLRVQT